MIKLIGEVRIGEALRSIRTKHESKLVWTALGCNVSLWVYVKISKSVAGKIIWMYRKKVSRGEDPSAVRATLLG